MPSISNNQTILELGQCHNMNWVDGKCQTKTHDKSELNVLLSCLKIEKKKLNLCLKGQHSYQQLF